jgi:flagellar protein FlgJ
MSVTTPAFVYTDLQALHPLKRVSREQAPEALREAAKQCEGMFIQMLLKSMRNASLGGGSLLDNEQSLFYRDLSDQQLALALAERGRLGLADMIVQQLGGEGGPRPQPAPNTGNPLALLQRGNQLRARMSAPVDEPTVSPSGAVTTSHQRVSPQAFRQQLWAHAKDAARRLDLAPEVLIAQAALETGWGRSVPRFSDGRSSHNLFGIKADSSWSGERVVNTTLEFANGLPVLRRDGFRAYRSYGESFADYVRFLRSNPRYAQALSLTRDSAAYLRALQKAGYATDPNYADKIQAILEGDFLERGEDLKSATAWPISPVKG